MAPYLFCSRAKAGSQLAAKLQHLKGTHPLVLALPRGGVPVAAQIAQALDGELDLLLVRKLGLPFQPELAMGAVTDGTHPRTFVNWAVVNEAKIPEAEVQAVAAREIAELERRCKLWRAEEAAIPIQDRVVVVVDDGVATGSSMRVALEAVRHAGARKIVLAVPVAAPRSAAGLMADCDEAVFLAMPNDFQTVGQYYADFHQLEDWEIHQLLHQTASDGLVH